MSRTFRKVSHRMKSFYEKDKVRDGSRTRCARSCENNGGCAYCESDRLHKHNKQPGLEDFLGEI